MHSVAAGRTVKKLSPRGLVVLLSLLAPLAWAGTVDPKANVDEAELDCAGAAADAKAQCVDGCSSAKKPSACRAGCEASYQSAQRSCEKRRDHMVKTQSCQRDFQSCIAGASESKKEGCRATYRECKEK